MTWRRKVFTMIDTSAALAGDHIVLHGYGRRPIHTLVLAKSEGVATLQRLPWWWPAWNKLRAAAVRLSVRLRLPRWWL